MPLFQQAAFYTFLGSIKVNTVTCLLSETFTYLEIMYTKAGKK